MGNPRGDKTKMQLCIVNVGLYRSGTTTLAKAATNLGLRAYREFPDLSPEEMKALLLEPETALMNWFEKNDGLQEIIRNAMNYDLICDGWIALLPFLEASAIERLKHAAFCTGVHLQFVATERNIEETVQSELQHWTVHDLERKTGLDASDRRGLEENLKKRALEHQRKVHMFHSLGHCRLLPLDKIRSGDFEDWSKVLSTMSKCSQLDWCNAIEEAGKCNTNPPLPVEGILLTMRIGRNKEAEKKTDSVARLLDRIEEDSLCRYVVVLAIDEDEECSDGANQLVASIQSRVGHKMKSLSIIVNPGRGRNEVFPMCSIWDEMAKVAWFEKGADWVVLLGDDVEIQCPNHYRAIYRSFLDIQERLKVPFGFGCPWWNDTSFPGFPSFPCVGKAHSKIFGGGLIPKHRRYMFVNQDLDPYLHRLYSKFGASPCVVDAMLTNNAGGPIGADQGPRYERTAAKGWKDHVDDDLEPIRKYLGYQTKEMILLDVVVPSYRVRLDYLESICKLKVPEYIHTLFIIIIDNRDALCRETATLSNQDVTTMTVTRRAHFGRTFVSSCWQPNPRPLQRGKRGCFGQPKPRTR